MARGGELGPLQCLPEQADLAAGPGAGQLGQCPGVVHPGHQVAHDVPPGYPVQVGDHRRQLDRRHRYGVVLSGGQSSSSLAFSAA